MPQNKYESWVRKSKDNLKWAKDNLKIRNYSLVCYLSQQAVELILKGYIYSKNNIPPKTHQLIRLAAICKKLELDLDAYLPKLAFLSEYYFESRYPNSLEKDLDKEEVADKASRTAQEIMEFVLKDF